MFMFTVLKIKTEKFFNLCLNNFKNYELTTYYYKEHFLNNDYFKKEKKKTETWATGNPGNSLPRQPSSPEMMTLTTFHSATFNLLCVSWAVPGALGIRRRIWEAWGYFPWARTRSPLCKYFRRRNVRKIWIVVEYSNAKSETNLKSELAKAISIPKLKASPQNKN